MRTNHYLLLLLLFTFVGCKHSSNKKSEFVTDDVVPVKVIPLEKLETDEKISLPGSFSSEDETILSFKTGGVIKNIFVNEGDFVKKDQLLAVLDLTEIKSKVQQAKLAYEKAQRDFKRIKNLYDDSVATLEQYQNLKTAMEMAQQVVSTSNFNLKHSEIRAYNDGYVMNKFATTGQIVGAGSPILQCNGAAQDNWIFNAELSDKEWASININDKAEILTDAYPNQKIKAKVIRKAESADHLTGMFSVDLKVEYSKVQLASGLFGRAEILTKRKMPLWSIPFESLLEGNANEGYVFVTPDNKVAKKIKVTIHDMRNDIIYISKGFENAGSLIVLGSAYLSDNSPIRIIEDKVN